MNQAQFLLVAAVLMWVCGGIICASVFAVTTKLMLCYDFSAYQYRRLVFKYAFTLGPVATAIGIHGIWDDRRRSALTDLPPLR